MNVGELIAELTKLDPNMPVVTFDREEGWSIVRSVDARPSEYGYYDDRDEYTKGGVTVAHLLGT